MPDDLSKKLKSYFERGGPKREVTNFDMGLSIIVVLVVLVIAAIVVWLVN